MLPQKTKKGRQAVTYWSIEDYDMDMFVSTDQVNETRTAVMNLTWA